MNNKLGVHSLVFTDSWDEEHARATLDAAARVGFDLVEVLMFDPEQVDAGMTRRLALDAGVDVAVGMALPAEADLSSPYKDVARRGEAMIARSMEVASEIGADALSGLIYAGFNRYAAPPTSSQRSQVVAALGRLSERAAGLGLRLGLEAINRYETYMVNTLDDAAALIGEIGASNMFVHLDTFHMNIEEADIAATIARNAELLGYVHLAENHRGTLGSGTFDFNRLFRALAQAGYQGALTVESFSPAALGPDLVGALGLWRQGWESSEEAATVALEFMRTGLASARDAQRIW